MEIRKFILDLKPDGSVKWAEVCEPGSMSKNALSLKRRAIEQVNCSTTEADLAYWTGFADALEALSALD